MVLRCPFCGAEEVEKLDAVDRDGHNVTLVMFDCPFYYRFGDDQKDLEERDLQSFLNAWKEKEGEEWLDSVGPIMKARELRNIERSKGHSSRNTPTVQ